MDVFLSIAFFFVVFCVFCAVILGGFMLVVGIFYLLFKLLLWLAYLGMIFILLGIAGFLAVKLWHAAQNYFS